MAQGDRVQVRNVIASDEGRARRMAMLMIEDAGGWVTRIVSVKAVPGSIRGTVGGSLQVEYEVRMVVA